MKIFEKDIYDYLIKEIRNEQENYDIQNIELKIV